VKKNSHIYLGMIKVWATNFYEKGKVAKKKLIFLQSFSGCFKILSTRFFEVSKRQSLSEDTKSLTI
jgi:hypothetical protein